ncbi:ferredoxin-fold anticodon-binding domain-containing protein 1 [Biomphalaria pfeifferi]|uniref:Ferredoxin-fold anticodon-binding domain-containing protein 1 n=1 Tax=Biomphalaria pfeifferi TaxID=112525 RepID=A0AAD8BIP5_BIOPF|nr:ferredoxin-fold anticodon-binding domain-containing protein 1 [Biomphalaria pfeifferi]
MDSPSPGNVLIVGDGDFSFTVSLMKKANLVGPQVTTSTIQTKDAIQQLQLGSENIDFLTEIGVDVLFETDARELHSHPVVRLKDYHRIIFNFPLADRHNIKKNRALLEEFFASCHQILVCEGHVFVTLCKGQGGTPADQPMRSWHDSWQVLAMAANAGFLLNNILTFDISSFPGYHSTGFRFQDKSFSTDGALTHIFEKAEPIRVQDDIKFRGVVTCGESCFSCSQYLVDKLDKDLLHKEDNPLCILRKTLEKLLACNMRGIVVLDPPSWQVLPACTSGVFVGKNLEQKSLPERSEEELIEVTVEEKERKNEVNTSLKVKTSLLKHGLDKTFKSTLDSLPSDNCLHHCVIDNPESVYLLLKNKIFETCGGLSQSCPDNNDVTSSGSLKPTGIDQTDFISGNIENKMYHFRASLLENLPDLLLKLNEDQTLPTEVVECDFSSGIILSGQCYVQCPIAPNIVPSQHELVAVFKLSSDTGSIASQSDKFLKDKASLDHDIAIASNSPYESLVRALDSTLNNSSLFINHNLHIEDYKGSQTIKVKGVDSLSHIKIISIDSSYPSSTISSELCSRTVGLTFKVKTPLANFCIAIFKLDAVAISICDIPDPRLLYSCSPKFVRQFQEISFPVKYLPFSLFPMKFVHDLSFWENGDFQETDLYSIVYDIAGDVVVNVVLIDLYTDSENGRKSRCYRLHFLSHDQVLSYLTSWKLQSLIRLAVAQKLGVTLR